MRAKLFRVIVSACRRLWLDTEIGGALIMREGTAYRAIVADESRRIRGKR